MIILCFFTKEYYLTAMIFNIVCTLAAVLIFIFGIAKGRAKRFTLPTVFLICSKAFVDFSTSGLENSLEYLIAAIFLYFYFKWEKYSRKQLLLLAFVGCLALLNRMDSILLLLPAIFDAFFLSGEENWKKNLLPGVVGVLPFLLWEVFSLFYYGFLFPNTAYAKLNSGIPTSEYMQQGVLYYLDSLNRDPITLFAIILAVFVCLPIRPSAHLSACPSETVCSRKMLCAGIGILLYGIYSAHWRRFYERALFHSFTVFRGCNIKQT